jgi:exonuclease III
VKVISWNLAGYQRRMPQQMEMLASRIADVVALQEGRRPGVPLLRTLLANGRLITRPIVLYWLPAQPS